jgi:aspartyl-tRNA(Asn)/glutamyl-tRNA(Gln) amidotransferase subunit C
LFKFDEESRCVSIQCMITPKELDHLAVLSRIKLSDEQKKSLLKEFDSILGYIDQLKKVKVSMEAEGRVGAVKNVMRPDVVQSVSKEDRERMLNEAPDREGDFIAVKKILG